MSIANLEIARLKMDFQPAENLAEDAVIEYVDRLRDGKKLDPVVVRFDGESYWLQDGFHRVEATKRLGIESIVTEIIPGTLADMEAEWQQHMEMLKKELAKEVAQRKLQKSAATTVTHQPLTSTKGSDQISRHAGSVFVVKFFVINVK